jgi:molybdate transport system substrate-binding protein
LTVLRILSGGAAEGLVKSVATDAAKAPMEIAGAFGAVGEMARRLRDGEVADFLVLTRELIVELAEAGLAVADSARDIGEVATSLAVRDGDTAPDVATQDALRAAFVSAPAIYCPNTETATAGRHVAAMLKKFGIWEETQGRLQVFPNGTKAMAALAGCGVAGAIGCTQATEILSTAGITLIGDLPEGVSLSTMYTAAMVPGSSRAAEAEDFIARLAQSPARSALGFHVAAAD